MDVALVSGTKLACDFDVGVCAVGIGAFAANFRDQATVTVWGNCIDDVTEDFCCRIADPAGELTQVDLFGMETGDDKLHYWYYATNQSLRPTGSGSLVTTLNGLGGSDDLYGSDTTTHYAETLHGNAGGDRIWGRNGKDTLRGGDDADSIWGDGAEDEIHGGNGVDTLTGGDGNDTIYGNNGVDYIYGDLGDDDLFGGASDDTMYGGAGHDEMYGSDGVNTMYGEQDDDVMFGAAGIDTMRGGDGIDQLHGGDDGDLLYGQAHADVIYGGGGGDLLDGGNGNDVLCDTPFVGSCFVTNTFYGGSNTDFAYLNGWISNGDMFCSAMIQAGSSPGSVETASHINRNWSAVLATGGTETTDPEPASCAALRALGGD